MRLSWIAALLLLAGPAALWGCGEAGELHGQTRKTPDARPADAEFPEATLADAVPVDAAPVTPDTMPVDASRADAMSVDAAPVTPDAMSVDAAPVTPDAMPVDAAPASPQVRMVYVVVTDRPFKSRYQTVMEKAAHHLRTWFHGQLGNGKSFRLRDPIVEVVYSTHDAAWYSTADNGDLWGPAYRWAWNARVDAIPLAGAVYDDPNNVWAFYIDSDNACGQYGGSGAQHILAVPANDLRGLAGEPLLQICPTDPASLPVCRWVGGLGHELGHAFGLPHPAGCDAGDPSCDTNALMWFGYASYPATYLRDADEKPLLNASPFFGPQSVAPTFDCSAL